MAHTNNHIVIMAGGVGSRFWPMSTPDCPKQFIDILGVGRTLLQLTFDRFKDVCPVENVWVVTNKKYASLVSEQLPEINKENILLEPCRRNTAPCIAYVSWQIKSKDPKANVVVTPSDHIVTDTDEFRRVIKSCLKFTAGTDAIVTLGMTPTRPETGYGYILADLSASSPRNREIYRVDSFREKPDLQTAEEYIKHKNYLWNAGIFVWSVSTIVNAFRVYSPAISKLFESMLDVYGTPQEQRSPCAEVAPSEVGRTHEYLLHLLHNGVIHRNILAFLIALVYQILLMKTNHDLYGNTAIGENIKFFDSHNCIVHTIGEKKVIVQGLDGYIVAENQGSLLVCKLSEEQRIRQFAEE